MNQKVILAVDDEQDCLEFIKSILEDEDVRVITAMDGKSAIEIVKSEKPDLIFLDVEMPKKDGLSTFGDLKNDEETKDIPICMLTGLGPKRGINFSKSDMGYRYGVAPQEYIEKPIVPEKLMEVVKKYL